MTAWATLAEVAEYPSPVTVTQAHLDVAQDMIELFSGTTEAASGANQISPRNLRHLNRAVIYQTIFVANHPEILTAMDVTGISHDGLSATYANVNAHLLAPLATRCVNRLTWKTAPLRVRSRANLAVSREVYGNRDSAIADDDRDWAPL